jgi:hypothetical protein
MPLGFYLGMLFSVTLIFWIDDIDWLFIYVWMWSLVSFMGKNRDWHRLSKSENRVLIIIVGPKREQVTGGQRKLHNLYSSNSMEQSPSGEANSCSPSQEIPHLSWNPKVHSHVHKSLPLVPVLNQIHPVHTFLPYFPKTHSSIIFPFMPRSSSDLFPSVLLSKILYAFLICHVCHMPYPSHPPWFDHPNNMWWSMQVMKLFIMQSSPSFCHFLPVRSKYSPQYLFSDTLSLFPSLSVRD